MQSWGSFRTRRGNLSSGSTGLVHVVSAAAWTPASLPNLAAWYIADTGVYKDLGSTAAGNGDSVEQWNDQSGNGRNLTQTTSGNRPTLNTSGINSHPAISFVVANDTFLTSAINMGGGTAISAFAVCTINLNSGGGNDRIISYIATSDGNDFSSVTSCGLLLAQASSSFPQIATVRNFATNHTDGSGPYTQAYGAIYDGANVNVYRSNVSGANAASSGSFGSTGTLGIGAEPTNPAPFGGLISEIVICTTALGTSDRASLQTYFSGKWGV